MSAIALVKGVGRVAGALLRWLLAGGQRLLWWCLGRVLNRGDRLARLIAANGIVIFVGPNGSGKSLAAVDAVLGTLAGMTWDCDDLDHLHNRPLKAHVAACGDCVAPRGRSAAVWCPDGRMIALRTTAGVRYAYSTLPLLDPATGEEHELYRALVDYRQLVEIEHADVVFDEVAGISDASDSASTPAALTRWLQQLRKRDVRLRVTTPAYKRCSLPIRQVATLVVDCRSYFPEASETGRIWRPRRAMLWAAYDGFGFAEFDKTTGDRLSREALRYYWRPTGVAQWAYSTLQQVLALAEVTDAGMCMACGGARSRPKCSCGPEVDHIAYGDLVVVEDVSKAGARVRHAVSSKSLDGAPANGPSSLPVDVDETRPLLLT